MQAAAPLTADFAVGRHLRVMSSPLAVRFARGSLLLVATRATSRGGAEIGTVEWRYGP